MQILFAAVTAPFAISLCLFTLSTILALLVWHFDITLLMNSAPAVLPGVFGVDQRDHHRELDQLPHAAPQPALCQPVQRRHACKHPAVHGRVSLGLVCAATTAQNSARWACVPNAQLRPNRHGLREPSTNLKGKHAQKVRKQQSKNGMITTLRSKAVP